MKLFCCYTASHTKLFSEYFLPSIPQDVRLVAKELDLQGEDHFLSPRFVECITAKVELIIRSLKDNLNECLIWSDIDIIFFNDHITHDIFHLLGNAEIAFQQEGTYTNNINSGFFIVRSNTKTIAFFELVLGYMAANPGCNEERAINQILRLNTELNIVKLPRRYYCRSFGWPPPGDMVLYHANCTFGPNGITQKIQQFNHVLWVRKFGLPALAISCLLNSRHRIKRIFSKVNLTGQR